MRFDDRLITVLRHSAATARDRAVQWRQLVELVARGAGEGNPRLRSEVLERIARLAADLPVEVRAAGARAIAGAPVPGDLMQIFVTDVPEVAAPLLPGLPREQGARAELRRHASAEVAALMDAMLPALPEPVQVPEFTEVPAPHLPSEIHETVTEPVLDLRSRPDPEPPVSPVPQPAPEQPAARSVPAASSAALFRWECGPTGEIDWVEGAPRAALIGRSIADDLDRRFAARLPFDDELFAVAEEGALAGDWRWSGSPAFFPDTGRFAGYRGVARREGAVAAAAPAGQVLPALDADQLRELVHELRTPLNAIIGFGEIIDGQYLGPAHRAYRERAAEIVGHARRLLSAVEDLDLAAKLQSGRHDAAAGAAVDEFFPALRSAVLEDAAGRGVALGITVRRHGDRSALPADLATRLVRRFLDAVLGVAEAGERFDLVVDRAGNHLAIAIDRPQATAGAGEEQMLDPAFDPTEGAALGIGFALRLVRGLAGIAGGRLEIAADRLVLLLPLAKG